VHEYAVREPWGVCAQILSWRRPLHGAARWAAPALAAGNAVIVKPSELASLPALRLAELAGEAGVPRGMLQVATGAGETGAALVAASDHVTFAGSPVTAQSVAAARGATPLALCVGRAATLVFADADRDAAARAVVAALLRDGPRRLGIEAACFDDVAARVGARLDALTVGPGAADPSCGPLISADRLERALAQLAETTVLAGGEHTGGLFLRPALVTGGEPADAPALSAVAFADEREAVALAGATTTVWTRDLARAHRVAAGIQAGQVFVNSYDVGGGVELPFGGMKRSGYGRAKGVDALLAYSQAKNVCVAL
jgi:aldehyde dehydrogenase (NAD+)/betaine-aldehyde dehydrogenase